MATAGAVSLSLSSSSASSTAATNAALIRLRTPKRRPSCARSASLSNARSFTLLTSSAIRMSYTSAASTSGDRKKSASCFAASPADFARGEVVGNGDRGEETFASFFAFCFASAAASIFVCDSRAASSATLFASSCRFRYALLPLYLFTPALITRLARLLRNASTAASRWRCSRVRSAAWLSFGGGSPASSLANCMLRSVPDA